MSRFVVDRDFVLHVGDALDVLAELRAESIDTCVTSPPYWGLRDYGDDEQLGLEATPELYVEHLAAVFAEVHRVLARHGTLWLNLGDTYATAGGWHNRANGLAAAAEASDGVPRGRSGPRAHRSEQKHLARMRHPAGGIKPKDLVGIPWKVAFALQAAGWYLRADVIWSKPNPMPESTTDRPTRAHEYVFLLAKSRRYYFDAEAIAEDAAESTLERAYLGKRPLSDRQRDMQAAGMHGESDTLRVYDRATRNARSVWSIPTVPYADAHFATYPPELARRALLAGCPELVCRVCGRPRQRVVERTPATPAITPSEASGSARPRRAGFYDADAVTVGFTDCGHDAWRRGIVLDPFIGSGTTALVARELERNCVGIELSPVYAAQAARRLQQLSLLAEAPTGGLDPAFAPAELTEVSA